jgi:hypothetical protein
MKTHGATASVADSTWHPNICDVCNEWTNVTEPRAGGYPKFECLNNNEKICIALMSALDDCIEFKNYYSAYFIAGRLQALIGHLYQLENPKNMALKDLTKWNRTQGIDPLGGKPIC